MSETSMKDILQAVFKKEGNGEEVGFLSKGELTDIIAFDDHDEYKNAIDPFTYPDVLSMHKKIDFLALETTLRVKLHASIIEYFSCFWADYIQIRNKKAVSDHHSNIEMDMTFLSCPSNIEQLKEKIDELNNDLYDIDDVLYIPIGRKMDGWKIAVNNNDGAVYVVGYHSYNMQKKANSIRDFFSE